MRSAVKPKPLASARKRRTKTKREKRGREMKMAAIVQLWKENGMNKELKNGTNTMYLNRQEEKIKAKWKLKG